jgi:hypothetical protein
LGVDEVQPDASLTISVGLLAILTNRRALVTLQMPLSARQTSCAYPFGLTRRCSASGIGWAALGNRAVSNSVRTGRRLF